MSKENIYLFAVDNYRRPSRQRNTSGRYLVSATSPKKAETRLRNTIGFGSIQLIQKVTPWDGSHIIGKVPSRVQILAARLRPKDVFLIDLKLKTNDILQSGLAIPRHCCDPLPE